MTTLSIYITNTTILAVEREWGEEVKYVESFDSWQQLLATLGEHMKWYAWITIVRETSY